MWGSLSALAGGSTQAVPALPDIDGVDGNRGTSIDDILGSISLAGPFPDDADPNKVTMDRNEGYGQQQMLQQQHDQLGYQESREIHVAQDMDGPQERSDSHEFVKVSIGGEGMNDEGAGSATGSFLNPAGGSDHGDMEEYQEKSPDKDEAERRRVSFLNAAGKVLDKDKGMREDEDEEDEDGDEQDEEDYLESLLLPHRHPSNSVTYGEHMAAMRALNAKWEDAHDDLMRQSEEMLLEQSKIAEEERQILERKIQVEPNLAQMTDQHVKEVRGLQADIELLELIGNGPSEDAIRTIREKFEQEKEEAVAKALDEAMEDFDGQADLFEIALKDRDAEIEEYKAQIDDERVRFAEAIAAAHGDKEVEVEEAVRRAVEEVRTQLSHQVPLATMKSEMDGKLSSTCEEYDAQIKDLKTKHDVEKLRIQSQHRMELKKVRQERDEAVADAGKFKEVANGYEEKLAKAVKEIEDNLRISNEKVLKEQMDKARCASEEEMSRERMRLSAESKQHIENVKSERDECIRLAVQEAVEKEKEAHKKDLQDQKERRDMVLALAMEEMKIQLKQEQRTVAQDEMRVELELQLERNGRDANERISRLTRDLGKAKNELERMQEDMAESKMTLNEKESAIQKLRKEATIKESVLEIRDKALEDQKEALRLARDESRRSLAEATNRLEDNIAQLRFDHEKEIRQLKESVASERHEVLAKHRSELENVQLERDEAAADASRQVDRMAQDLATKTSEMETKLEETRVVAKREKEEAVGRAIEEAVAKLTIEMEKQREEDAAHAFAEAKKELIQSIGASVSRRVEVALETGNKRHCNAADAAMEEAEKLRKVQEQLLQERLEEARRAAEEEFAKARAQLQEETKSRIATACTETDELVRLAVEEALESTNSESRQKKRVAIVSETELTELVGPRVRSNGNECEPEEDNAEMNEGDPEWSTKADIA